MGNAVGSTNADFCNYNLDNNKAYILGLWCADGYTRTSSLGLSNIDEKLIDKFNKFLSNYFPLNRLRLKVFYPSNNNNIVPNPNKNLLNINTKYYPSQKAKHTAYHLYVNSRPMVRWFKQMENNVVNIINKNLIIPYFAGRFDGDGSVAKDFYSDCRIVYSNLKEAENDLSILQKLNFEKLKLYYYRSAKTYCLYISRYETKKFLEFIYPYSIKLQKSVFVPRRDLILTTRV